MKPLVGYGRVSRIGDRKERLRSFEFQDREIRQAAANVGVPVLEIIADPDESGANPERKGLLRAIRMVEDGEVSGIVVAKLDRFSRDLRQSLELAERVHRAGGRILSFAENPDWLTPEGELHVSMTFAFAQHERRVKSAAFEKSKARAVAQGIPVTPRLPPGLKLVLDEHGNRVGAEHDEEAPVMEEFFQRRARGAGPTALAEFLERHGVATSMGSTSWSKQAVYGLIRNRAYLGELRQGEHVNERAWEPVVDRATWEAAQEPAVLMSAAGRGSHPDLAVGLARCASCRYSLNATNTSRGRRVYRCPGRHAAGRCPAPARMYADELEPLVEAAFRALAREHHARGSKAADRGRVDELRAAADRADRGLAMYRDDADLEDTDEAVGGMAAWREGLRAHRERRDDAFAALAREEQRVRRGEEVPAVSTLRRDWRRMADAERRVMLSALIDCVAVLPRSSGLPPEGRVVVFAAGHGPTDIPRRGFRERPMIRGFDIPHGAGVR